MFWRVLKSFSGIFVCCLDFFVGVKKRNKKQLCKVDIYCICCVDNRNCIMIFVMRKCSDEKNGNVKLCGNDANISDSDTKTYIIHK